MFNWNARPTRKKHRFALRTLLAGLLTLVLFTASACGMPRQGPAATSPAPTGPEASLPPPASAYEIGQPVVTELYVSPDGDDANDGLSAAAPLRTLTAAWERIPAGESLSGSGYRINLLPGTYPCEPAEPDNCQNYFGGRHGTYEFPIIIHLNILFVF